MSTLVESVVDGVVVLRDGTVWNERPAAAMLGYPANAYTQDLLAAVPHIPSRTKHDAYADAVTTLAESQP